MVMQLWLFDKLCCSSINANLDIVHNPESPYYFSMDFYPDGSKFSSSPSKVYPLIQKKWPVSSVVIGISLQFVD